MSVSKNSHRKYVIIIHNFKLQKNFKFIKVIVDFYGWMTTHVQYKHLQNNRLLVATHLYMISMITACKKINASTTNSRTNAIAPIIDDTNPHLRSTIPLNLSKINDEIILVVNKSNMFYFKIYSLKFYVKFNKINFVLVHAVT